MPQMKELPPHMLEKLNQYVDDCRPVGDFLQAVIANDLAGAVRRADDENIHYLREYVEWLYWNAPSAAHGDRSAYLRWIRNQKPQE